MAINSTTVKKKRKTARAKRVLDPKIVFDYKDVQLLKRFVTDAGKIVPRRINGSTSQQQSQLSQAVKRAYNMALLGFQSIESKY